MSGAEAASRVLVVEDDADVRAAIALFLASHGYEVLEARHGAEALALLRDAAASGPAVGLVLLDLMMPVMDGWTFRAEQLGDPALASIPVIVVTADAAAAGKSRQLAAAAFLLKPIDLDDLLDLVRACC
jgi:CheY-like chemotaxis protein